jgi:TolB protein
MKLLKIFLFLIFSFLFYPIFFKAQEPPIITVSPEGYAKTVVKIIPFSGDKGAEVANLLKRALNLHLIILALEERAPSTKDPTLKGSVSLSGGSYFFQGELTDPISGKSFNLRAEATNHVLLVSSIADKVVELLTKYQGISLSKIAFVRRTERADELIITDFLKQDFRRLRTAELILFPKFSPSGKKIAYIVYEKGTYRLEVDHIQGLERKEYRIKGIAGPPVWLPDEERMILTLEERGEVGLFLFDLRKEEISKLHTGLGVRQAGSVSPDGRFAAFVASLRDKPQVYMLNLSSGEARRVSFEGGQETSPRFSPKGNLLIYLLSQKTLVLYDLSNNKKTQLALTFSITDPSFSPTGDYLIFRAKGKKGGIYILHLDSRAYQAYLPYDNLYYPDWGRH